MPPTIRTYESDAIVIRYDVKRCIHAAECVKGLPRVFDPKRRPWVDLSQANADEIANVVMACPTGALQYTRQDGGLEEVPPRANEVTVEADGPLYARGDLEIYTPEGVSEQTRAALCRCGASHNKPFCDNSHLDVDFEDEGNFTVPNEPTTERRAGRLTIKPQPDGPLLLEGSFHLRSHDGEQSSHFTEQAWCCRCGQSQNKPFCDGSHNRVAFQAD